MVQTQKGVSLPNAEMQEEEFVATTEQEDSTGVTGFIEEGLSIATVILVFATLGFAIALKISSSINSKGKAQAEKYWGMEREANFARSKPIDESVYYHPNVEILQLEEILYSGLCSQKTVFQAEKVIKLSETKMINFPKQRSNLELKTEYGRSNLDDIIMYEENFRKYYRSIVELAENVFNDNHPTKALQLAMNAVSIYPNASSPYVLMVKIYHADEAYKLVDRIKEEILSRPDEVIESAVKNKIVRKIEELRNN